MSKNQLRSKAFVTCNQLAKELEASGDTQAARVLDTAKMFLLQDTISVQRYLYLVEELTRTLLLNIKASAK